MLLPGEVNDEEVKFVITASVRSVSVVVNSSMSSSLSDDDSVTPIYSVESSAPSLVESNVVSWIFSIPVVSSIAMTLLVTGGFDEANGVVSISSASVVVALNSLGVTLGTKTHD